MCYLIALFQAAKKSRLSSEIANGRFREDLYYRLAVVKLYIPPLRKRRQDIPRLVVHFLKKHAHSGKNEVTSISREAWEAFVRYDYPGNVRELENIVESAIVMSRGPVVTTEDLPMSVRAQAAEQKLTSRHFQGSLPQQVDDLERQLILDALRAAGGVECQAAERLGISERTLRYKLEKHRISRSPKRVA